MSKVLLLGAGFVARPLVEYILNQPNIQLTVASLYLEDSQRLVHNHPHAVAQQLDVENQELLDTTISNTDIVISLLPWTFHIKVAKLCLKHRKHLVTASYVKPEMRALDAEAHKHGLLFLNEIGVDPGIDHMAAMRIIDNVKHNGGKINSFFSYCGGLPAPEHNTNPLGYKFSWSPVGVMLAASNSGRYLLNGNVVDVPADELFKHYWLVEIPGAGSYEAYVNRDALPYIDTYGIQGVKSMCRGTLRNIGHCETWHYFKQLGLLNQNQTFDFSKTSPRQMLAHLTNSHGDIKADVAAFLKIPLHSITIHKLDWLGLFEDTYLPLKNESVFNMFAYILQKKLVFTADELDIVLQQHEFIAEYPDATRQKIVSTMVNKGIPDGDSSMARTVGLPAAIATTLILQKKIQLTGVHIPVLADIYKPVLQELEKSGITFVEKIQQLSR